MIQAYPALKSEVDATSVSYREAAQAANAVLDIQRQIAGAQTIEELQRLREALTNAYLAGQVAAEDYSATLDAIKVKQREVEEASQSGFAGALGGYISEATARFKAAGDEYVEIFNRLQAQSTFKNQNASDYILATNKSIAYVDALIAKAQKAADAAAATADASGAAASTVEKAANVTAASSATVARLQETIANLQSQVAALKQQQGTGASSGSQQTVTVKFVVGPAGPFPATLTKDAATAFIEELEAAAGVSLVN